MDRSQAQRYIPGMVTERERQHFRRIADAERELNREAVHRTARRPPGQNIEAGFELSAFAAAFGGVIEKLGDKVSPAALRTALREKRSTADG